MAAGRAELLLITFLCGVLYFLSVLAYMIVVVRDGIEAAAFGLAPLPVVFVCLHIISRGRIRGWYHFTAFTLLACVSFGIGWSMLASLDLSGAISYIGVLLFTSIGNAALAATYSDMSGCCALPQPRPRGAFGIAGFTVGLNVFFVVTLLFNGSVVYGGAFVILFSILFSLTAALSLWRVFARVSWKGGEESKNLLVIASFGTLVLFLVMVLVSLAEFGIADFQGLDLICSLGFYLALPCVALAVDKDESDLYSKEYCLGGIRRYQAVAQEQEGSAAITTGIEDEDQSTTVV